jgi:hypothetical protein
MPLQRELPRELGSRSWNLNGIVVGRSFRNANQKEVQYPRVPAQARNAPLAEARVPANAVSNQPWWATRDSNPDGLPHTPLKRARLPVPPAARLGCRKSEAPCPLEDSNP